MSWLSFLNYVIFIITEFVQCDLYFNSLKKKKGIYSLSQYKYINEYFF